MSGAEVVALVSVVVAGVISPAILSYAAARRQRAEHAERRSRDEGQRLDARRREERDHLRGLFEEGAVALRAAMGAVTPWTVRPATTLEEAT